MSWGVVLVGELALTHFYPETSDDRWWQAALTVDLHLWVRELTRIDRLASSAAESSQMRILGMDGKSLGNA